MTARTVVSLAALVSIIACGPSPAPTASPGTSPPGATAHENAVDPTGAGQGQIAGPETDPIATPGGPSVEPGEGTIGSSDDPKPSDHKPSGSMDKDIIRRVVRSHLSEVKRCYEAGLGRDPSLTGRVAIQFTIGPEGAVTAAKVHTSDVKDAAVGDCIASAIRTWVFPKPEGGGNVVVSYPFLLAPDTSDPPQPDAAP